MKFIDLFAGIGGFRLGMERAGHECIAFCEIDKYARRSYKAIHDTEGEVEMHDITTVSDEFIRGIGHTDIICGGFPCQAFSIAGKRRGFQDTRGTLFFEIMRFASILRPRYLFLENVKGLLNHENGDTFETILRALDECGYDVEWQVCNSKYFGVPQNRERVFIIGHLRGERTRKVFPFRGESECTNQEQPKINILGTTLQTEAKGTNSRHWVYDTAGLMSCLDATMYKQPKQIAIPVLTPDRIEKRQNGRRFKEDGEEMFTLTSQDRHGVIIQKPRGYNLGGEHEISPTVSSNSWQENNLLKVKEATIGDSVNISHPTSKTRRGRVGKQLANTLLTGEEQAVVSTDFRIRKLTPLECWRLQGFPDWAFYKAAKVNSNSQLYKQAGNSVTVNVIEEIAKRL
ncbi:MAG: DNA cytosine methyltransferase [Streptococcaceae bacterium]|jgi:DNA (cytosine-5)-methyltransferase 1|nr:DNA cytosine methyltransferase [Streptococcaceae bacterium]